MLVKHSHFLLLGHDPRGLDEMIDVPELDLGDALHKVILNTDTEDPY